MSRAHCTLVGRQLGMNFCVNFGMMREMPIAVELYEPLDRYVQLSGALDSRKGDASRSAAVTF